MDPAYISAASGFAGVVFGGLASLSATHLSQMFQRREADRTKRAGLFASFIAEATHQYADALSHEKDDVQDLVQLYALAAQLRLFATRPVITAAEKVLDVIVDAYLQPNKSLHELRDLARSGGMNFLAEFSEASRRELSDQIG